MIQISYISSVTEPMSTQDLLKLLQECRERCDRDAALW